LQNKGTFFLIKIYIPSLHTNKAHELIPVGVDVVVSVVVVVVAVVVVLANSTLEL